MTDLPTVRISLICMSIFTTFLLFPAPNTIELSMNWGRYVCPPIAAAAEETDNIAQIRMAFYLKNEAITHVPWYYLAAIDQYERNIQDVRPDLEKREDAIAIQIPAQKWAGILNPNENDVHLSSIAYFNGLGKDGDGDGAADRTNNADILYTMASYLAQYGFGEDDIKIALWNYYERDRVVHQIMTIAQIYRHFGTIELYERSFPMPLTSNYSYRSTWGAKRGWGGARIHEGTDVFAGHGVPVRSTTYGVVEIMGWNRYGGWRVGIRDTHNTYHYFAHLSSFNDDIQEGDIIEPGTVIGYVGNTGYGKPGTAGKFPPHLHYGMYKFNGRTEWSFDPYPYLRRWEKSERSNG